MIYLDRDQVRGMIKQAEQEGEVIVIRCVRITKASKASGPDKGDLYDLHCTTKPPYTAKTARDRSAEDAANGVLTVWVTNRKNRQTGEIGDWRRVNIKQVQKVTYKNTDYEVKHS